MNVTSTRAPDLRLRALEPEDLDLLYTWENTPELWSEGETFQPWSREVLRQFANGIQDIYTNKQLRLVIESMEGRPLGLLDFFDFDARNRRSGIGILIADDTDRRRGYGSQALRLGVEFAFSSLLLQQLYCDILESNVGSIALFEKVGFEQTGLKKNWIQQPEGLMDVRFYQYLRQS